VISQFRMLGKVKTLREDKALRALQKARTILREAEARLAALEAEVANSAASLPARERALFVPVLGQTVGMPDIDVVKENVLDLHRQHHELEDRRDRARDHVKRCEQALEAARKELRIRQQDVEKITTVTDELVTAQAADQLAREEIEIEDAFSRPKPAPKAATPEVAA
jgi:flagellar biosynthesis chaperone FliJ